MPSLNPISEQFDEYRRLLRQHDWSFEYSEDHSVWGRGRQALAVLCNLQQSLDPDFTIWNSIAPSDYQRKPKA